VAEEADVRPVTFDQDDVKQMIAVAQSRNRLFRLIAACDAARLANQAGRPFTPATAEAQPVPPGDLVSPTVIFHSTGERISVTLPLELGVRDAARRIIEEIFLRDLPPARRALYARSFAVNLVHDGKVLHDGTLRDAGIDNASELSVSAYTPWPFAHDADAFRELVITHRMGMMQYTYRLHNSILSTLFGVWRSMA